MLSRKKNHGAVLLLFASAILLSCTQKYRIYPDLWKQNNDRAVQFFVMGEEYENRKYIDNAIYAYSQAIRLDSGYAAAYFSRGSLYSLKNENTKAIEDISRAIKIQPHDGWFYISRGIIYFNAGEYMKALPDLRISAELLPVTRITAYYYLGATFAMLKNAKKSVSYLQKALFEGYDNVTALREDPAFRYIREEQVFQKFVERLENLKKINK